MSLAAGRLSRDGLFGFSSVRSRRGHSSAGTEAMTDALELRVLVTSFDLVVREAILHGTLVTVPDDGRMDDFRLNPLLSSERRVPLFNLVMQASRSRDQFFVQ